MFWSAFGGVFLVSLLAFTFTIGDGRLSGPGICLALSAGVLVWVARMLFQAARSLVSTGAVAEELEQKAASGRRRKELEREYYTLKRALKELELDYSMSKVSEDDYQEIRGRYRERAVRILRQLDQGESYRAQIEADLQARRAAGEPAKAASAPEEKPAAAPEPVEESAEEPPAPAAKDEAPAAAPERSKQPEQPVQGVCEKCQTRNDGDAVFCKKCGDKIKAA